MDLQKNKIEKKGTIIGVIPIQHTSKELINILKQKEWYETIIQNKCETRKRELLTVRYLVYLLLGEEKEIIYTNEGKPRLADQSYYISISHTKGYVAIALNKDHDIGIDIESISPRVQKIRSRFLSKTEEKQINKESELIHLLLHWSAKEALYKILDDHVIEFKTHLHIQNFIPKLNEWDQFNAIETKSPEKQAFVVDYLVSEDYVLTVIK